MDSVCFLLYASQVTEPYDHKAKEALKEKAALLNRTTLEITGVLVYRQGTFLQYLEGQESCVLDLFRRLRGNPKHCNVRILGQGSLEQRLFSEWSTRWVPGAVVSPPSESLIDLFEMVLSAKTVTKNELSAVLRRFWKDSECFDPAPLTSNPSYQGTL